MNCLIIGYGSIGTRHAGILTEMGHDVSIVSKRDITGFPCYKSIKEALKRKRFDYVIVSNETSNHYNSFLELNKLKYAGKILIEKPIFAKTCLLSRRKNKNVFVGYNLRFHPIIQKLRQFLENKQLYSVQVYVGQHLPDWRPRYDYTKCYSAYRAKGGGVLRDLSHEIDYLNWLTGGWKRLAAIGGKFSNLKIDSDDIFVLLIEMKNCPVVCVQMNYLDYTGRREIIINLNNASIKADLINNTIETNGQTEKFAVEKNLTYELLHKAILNGNFDNVCKFKDGLDVLKIIQAAEISAEKRTWINR